jgi:protein SCO1/2
MIRLRYRLTPLLLALGISMPFIAPPSLGASDSALSAAAHEYFTDVELVTQNGDSVRLYSDLLKRKVVVINTFFGTCTGSCPRMSGLLAGLQDRLGDQLGKDVFLLSFSVDPAIDTPEKLKQYAEQYHARPGWLFLTGKKENVDFALSKLGPKLARREDHMTVFTVWNDRTGLIEKVPFSPASTAESLHSVIESVLNDKE